MKVELAHKPIGELNGPWAFLLKVSLTVLPIFMSTVLAWGVWVTKSVNELSKNDAVTVEISKQIAVNTGTIARHDREIGVLVSTVGRFNEFVTRAEWELRNKTRDTELSQDRAEWHEAMKDLRSGQRDLAKKIDDLIQHELSVKKS